VDLLKSIFYFKLDDDTCPEFELKSLKVHNTQRISNNIKEWPKISIFPSKTSEKE